MTWSFPFATISYSFIEIKELTLTFIIYGHHGFRAPLALSDMKFSI